MNEIRVTIEGLGEDINIAIPAEDSVVFDAETAGHLGVVISDALEFLAANSVSPAEVRHERLLEQDG